MRVTKSLVFLITTLVMYVGLSLTPLNASAGPLPSLFGGAREEAKKEVKLLLNEASFLNKSLAKLDLKLENTVDGLRDLISEAKDRLEACPGGVEGCNDLEVIHAVQLLLEQAQRNKARILVIDIGAFLDHLHEFEVDLGELEGKIGGLKEIGKILVSDGEFMEIELNACNELITFMDSDFATISAQLEDGDQGEDPNDPTTWDDVNDFIAGALSALVTDESLQDVDAALENAKAVLDEIIRTKETTQGDVSECRSHIKNVQRVLNKRSTSHVNLSIGSQGEAKVYTLSGQLVNVGTASALDRNALANGVYVVVYSDGRVEKLVVLH
ncbi:T9SS type A sorting domain-containing protein [Candidatus Acetothermia bacterium]|nr:T9SS type A sorting domain-containing protein [Candidatus Acetothermia bacterium]